MKIQKTEGGFEFAIFRDNKERGCSFQQSNEACEPPGTSAIWLGASQDRMYLDRATVAELVQHLQAWLATGSFQVEAGDEATD